MMEKQGRESTSPIKVESEEDESPKNLEDGGNTVDSKEESQESKLEVASPLRRKGKTKPLTLTKGLVTCGTKALASRKQPARKGVAKQGEAPSKRLKKT